MASRLTCSGPQWDTSGRGRICWLSCFTKFERKAIKKINFRLCCWTLSGQVTWMRRVDAGAGAAAARPSLLWLCNLFQRQKIAKITKMRNERQTLDVYELSFKTIVADQWIDESITGYAAINDVPSELQKSFGRVRDTIFGPRKEMELGDCSCLSRADVLQVERTDQVIVAPDMFADQMDLFEPMNQSSIGRII